LCKLAFLLAALPLSAADFAPALDWVTAVAPASSLVAAAASDGRGNLYVTGTQAAANNTDAFVAKLDINCNIIYSMKFGGSGNDTPAALAVGSDGSVYVAGSTTSTDLPITPGAYLTQFAASAGTKSNFVFKLNPDGSLGWATYFPGQGIVAAIAVDVAGNPFVAGSTAGGLPTTPGAYQTFFQQSVTSNGFFSVIGPLAAFVTKLNARGTGVIYSTYISADNRKNIVPGTQALAVDAAGNAWIGAAINPGIVPLGPNASVVELNPNGSALIASTSAAGLDDIAAIALDAASNVYVAGAHRGSIFPATPGAFQPAPQPAVPTLPYQPQAGGGMDAFVAKWDSSLTHLLAATLLGGENLDAATSIAIDPSGAVIVSGYTDSKAFPTRAPFQASFSTRAGFVAGFDASLSNLLFSTYLGDGRPFTAQAAIPDGRAGLLLAGSTLRPGASVISDGSTEPTPANLAIANRIALPPAPSVRLDSVQNAASRIAGPLAPGETIVAVGAGFGSGAQIIVDGSPLATISATDASIVAALPDSAAISGAHTIQVSSNGALSNAVYVPAAPASPGIYSVDGSGVGQGYILNSDGTRNSPANPAAPGSAITIYVTGAGQYSLVNGYAVAAQMPAVFIDGFYCNGIAAVIGAVDGLPGNVYQLRVYVPDPAELAKINPDLKNFNFPPQSGIQLTMVPQDPTLAGVPSQSGIFINIR
jgi:uncharacterized protein (TIGR03437 family)